LSGKSNIGGLLNLCLLVDLSVDCCLELLDLFLLDKKFLLLLEGLDLLLDDLSFLSLFRSFLFLRINDNLSHSDLLLNLFLLYGNLLKALRSKGQLSSGGGLLGHVVFSLGCPGLNFLLFGGDAVGGKLVNLLLDL